MLQHHLGHQPFFTCPNNLVLDLSTKDIINLDCILEEDHKILHLQSPEH